MFREKMLVDHQSRNLKKTTHHRRRSPGLTSSKNLKRRINARRLVALAEDERMFKRSWLLNKNACTGLLGGTRETKISEKMLDQEKFLEAIRYVKVLNISSKKEFWKTVARQYFGNPKMKKSKIDKLRLAWRRNEGGIREKVNKNYAQNEEYS